MTPRKRWLKTLFFEEPDRIPLEPLPDNGRESTLARWHAEGLPRDTANIAEYAYRQAGGQLEWPDSGYAFAFWDYDRMRPQFEEKVIERKERTLIVQDWKGNICEISDKFDMRYLRKPIDFVTRRWIKCPVESRADWADMKRRYDPDDPGRLPEDAAAKGKLLKDRTWPITIHFSGPFWILREWLGFENLCMMFHDDPAFITEMIEFWEDYVCRLLERAFEYVTPDSVHFSEDMAYKKFSMISPEMVRKFLLPSYKHWGELVRKAQVPIYAVDSDGFIGELIPIWIEAGVNCCEPIEVAAGNDIVAFRKEFGKDMAYHGGVDKRAMAAGGKTIEEEINRICGVIDSGGYIPGCDHGVPADVSWPNFVRYTKLLAKVTGWL